MRINAAGFSLSLCEAFKDGFPKNWKQLVWDELENIGRSSAMLSPAKTPSRSEVMSPDSWDTNTSKTCGKDEGREADGEGQLLWSTIKARIRKAVIEIPPYSMKVGKMPVVKEVIDEGTRVVQEHQDEIDQGTEKEDTRDELGQE